VKPLLKLLPATVILLDGFMLVGGVSSVVAVCWRRRYHDPLADFTVVALVAIGFTMVYLGKAKWDRLS
jgi:hypothetical protein